MELIVTLLYLLVSVNIGIVSSYLIIQCPGYWLLQVHCFIILQRQCRTQYTWSRRKGVSVWRMERETKCVVQEAVVSTLANAFQFHC